MASEASSIAEATAEQTGAIDLNANSSKEPSKNALKKAEKKKKLEEEKNLKALKAAQVKDGAAKQSAKKPAGKQSDMPELKAVTATKETNFAEWYSQTLTKGGFIAYTDISGCYVYRPASFHVWEEITQYFDQRIKSIGVKNCYFPMFATKEQLEVEQNHVEGFAAEVAWVTKYGNSKLEKEIAIRPTSEVGTAFARSHMHIGDSN